MKVEMMDLKSSKDYRIFNKLQWIINENLVSNGGTLRQGNLLQQDYDWTHLFLAKEEGKIIGFAILRLANFDQHMTGFNEYYYISDIVVAKEYQNKGVGTMLLKSVLGSVVDLPIVASVKDTNNYSLKLFKKNMKVYHKSQAGYYRFLDSNSYDLRAGVISDEFRF